VGRRATAGVNAPLPIVPGHRRHRRPAGARPPSAVTAAGRSVHRPVTVLVRRQRPGRASPASASVVDRDAGRVTSHKQGDLDSCRRHRPRRPGSSPASATRRSATEVTPMTKKEPKPRRQVPPAGRPATGQSAPSRVIATGHLNGTVRVAVVGEIDIAVHDRLRAALADALCAVWVPECRLPTRPASTRRSARRDDRVAPLAHQPPPGAAVPVRGVAPVSTSGAADASCSGQHIRSAPTPDGVARRSAPGRAAPVVPCPPSAPHKRWPSEPAPES
jgi:hypothetical protein